MADSQSVFRELYVALTVAAPPRRVRLRPLVTDPLTRHLVVTASAIRQRRRALRRARGAGRLGRQRDLHGGRAARHPRRARGWSRWPAHRGGDGRGGGPPVARAPRRPPGADLPRRGGAMSSWRAGGRRGDRRARAHPGGACRSPPSSAAPARPAAPSTTSTCGCSPRPAWPSSAEVHFAPISGAGRERQSRLSLHPRRQGRAARPPRHRIRALQRAYDSHHHDFRPTPACPTGSASPTSWSTASRWPGTPADCVAQVEAMAAGARQFLITGFVPDPRAAGPRRSADGIAV